MSCGSQQREPYVGTLAEDKVISLHNLNVTQLYSYVDYGCLTELADKKVKYDTQQGFTYSSL